MPESENWAELIDSCIFNNIEIAGVDLLTEDESNVKQETVEWKFLYNCEKRVMIETKYAMQLSRKPVTEVKLIDSLENLLRYNIAVNLRKRKQENTHRFITDKKQTNNVFSKAILVPAAYVTKQKRIATAYYLLMKDQENENEMRMKVSNRELYPGIQIKAHCPTNQTYRSTVKSCYASGEVQLPDGDYDIDDLLHTEFDFKWTNAWHTHHECINECNIELIEKQINQFETGNQWKNDRDGCLMRRLAKAREILNPRPRMRARRHRRRR